MTDKLLSKISSLLKMMLLLATLVFSLSFHAVKGNAQIVDQDYQSLLERDKSVPKERVEKAFAEAKKIQDSVLEIIAKKKSGFVQDHTSSRHLQYDIPGRRGTTRNEMSWNNGNTILQVYVELEFNNSDAVKSLRHGMESISMGEFFEVRSFGEEARLIKNVESNQRMTNVGLHFVKGRAVVSIYVTNHKRIASKNEKVLMEVARLVEPLVVARPNFDDQ